MAHPGTYVNAPTLGVTGLVPGDPDTAVTFDPASDQYVVQDDTVAQQTFSAFTIGGILKPNDATDPNAPLWWNISGAIGLQLGIGQDIGGGVRFVFVPGGGFSGVAYFVGDTVMSNGSTYRVICTWDGALAKLYVNGALDGGVLTGGGGVPYSGSGGTGPFGPTEIIAGGGTGAWIVDEDASFFGATDVFDTTGNFSFDGTLDELFFVINHAATADEIAAIDAAMTGTGNVETEINALSPYIYWRLGEASGTTAEDSASSIGLTYTPPIAYDMGPVIPDTRGLQRLLFRHYPAHGRFVTVWKLATDPITYSIDQPYPLITPEDVAQGNVPIGQTYNDATYLHVYYGPETVDADEAARLIASGIGTVT